MIMYRFFFVVFLSFSFKLSDGTEADGANRGIYSFEAKRNYIKVKIADCQLQIDSLQAIIVQRELESNNERLPLLDSRTIDPKRHEGSLIAGQRHDSRLEDGGLISRIDSLSAQIRKYKCDDKAIQDSIRAYLKGLP